jgi:hypothetical protein
MLRDVTFTDVSRAEAVDDASAGFVMDEDTFRVFYERTARGVCLPLPHHRRSSTGGRSAAGNVLSVSAHYRDA